MVINKFPNREVYEKIKAKGSLGADDVNVLEDYGYTLTETDKTEIADKVIADGTEFTLSDFPTALKNPHALTFTGAATGTYDGSEALTITIPEGGSGGSSGNGGLRKMSAVASYIGIPVAELPQDGTVWMCISKGDGAELYSGTVTIEGGSLTANNLIAVSSGSVIQLNQATTIGAGFVIYGMSATDYVGVWQQVSAGDAIPGTDLSLGVTGAMVGQIAKISATDENGKPTKWEPVDMPSGGEAGGETWALVAETTTTENVNMMHITFAACSAVVIEFYWGGVENDLGNIGIFLNAEGTPYTSEYRFVAANVTSSTTKKRGVLCVQIDCRVGSHWYATSWQKDRSDGSFGTIDASAYNNLDIGLNGSAQYSVINNYYMTPRNDAPANGVRSITAYGAGMAVGTTLKVWGIKK